ncbi:EAL domain-containing protein [Colwellia sp. BRX8-7]|jgi:diguanylate cyclase (GGDEF)-like protein|uniref:bifunctional diguanylate cyclase/phosphodiesterase n=1 Tax=unclassified Colwellia TaxID=196834 RepID=UPI0015F4528F|nr:MULTISPECIES: EAL domain-containing protein [unclassified Colwellia]MBA6362737.1 EAL domain-containing protein [Colwellia sp. BRX8-8]MBA6336239.1 EAL domain-containing protein [Colwellia sp. BRX8-7]MBA6349291.1 EAL domain-containing protein [Colwellia sp. BRX8-9]MBA6352672.1 EAL domain-containing protein [Colwellia sp. BRX9-1]MBA6372695.1 EAL domain-containing protein [Colwellia sp. BRX8-4]
MNTRFSFKAQITWLLTSLILLTVIILTGSNWFRFADYAENQIERQMYFAQNVLDQTLRSQERVLTTTASVLAADFGFKQAVATRDKNTVESVLFNHGKRINADLMLILDLEGKLSTTSSLHSFDEKTIQANITKLPFREVHAQILSIENKVYQVIVVPVKAPRVIAYTVIGFEFDQVALLKLKDLIALDLTLVQNNQLIESSIEREDIIKQLLQGTKQQSPNLLLTRADYFHKTINFGGSKDIKATLSVPLTQIQSDFNRLIFSMLIIAVIVIVIAITFSRLLSRGLSTPLHILMEVTKKIGRGELNVPKLANRLPVEFSELYQGFSLMGAAIENREQSIVYQAERDILTGLYNRHKTLTKVADYFNKDIHLVVITFNIKAFKALNDTIGLTNGDNILKEIAARILVYIEKSNHNLEHDIIAARTNSDEFLLAVPIQKTNEIKHFIELLQSELNRPFWLDDIKINLSLYFGVANSIEHGVDAERLIRRSTMAVASAYQDQVLLRFYQDGEDEAYLYKLRLIEELKEALECEVSPLFMNYQPKLNMNTGKIDKLEALIRWINKEGNFVNPELFIDLAEKAGLIVSLTRWVILQVIQQTEQWNKMGYRFKVAINLSAQDIQNEQFVDYLLNTVNNHEVSTSQITLELTERDIAENEALVVARLSHLKSLGFLISVDDYGIGQSSLAKLKSLPVDELKIDKTFILKLEQCQKDQDIVASTISLGHKLGLSVVAEGVENKESLMLLNDFQCDYAQGYYLSRPVSAEKFIEWYKTYESPL